MGCVAAAGVESRGRQIKRNDFHIFSGFPDMDIKHYMNEIGQRARKASRAMAKADTGAKNRALSLIAAAIRRDADTLRAANRKDLDAARVAGLTAAMLDRLTLS